MQNIAIENQEEGTVRPTELKLYKVGSYTFYQPALTLEKDMQLVELIKSVGGTTWESFNTAKLSDVIDTLFHEGFLTKAFVVILEFHDENWWAKWRRERRMRKTTKAQILGKLVNPQMAEIIADFFVENLSSMPLSSTLFGNTTSTSETKGSNSLIETLSTLSQAAIRHSKKK